MATPSELSPNVSQLSLALTDLVRWEEFAIQLDGIDHVVTAKIQKEVFPDVEKWKMALYNKWLAVYPDATWSDVVKALKIIGENRLAQKVEREHMTRSSSSTHVTSGIEESTYVSGHRKRDL